MSIEIKTATRRYTVPGRNEYEPDTHREVHTVELRINGVCFETTATDASGARRIAADVARTLFIDDEGNEITVSAAAPSIPEELS